MTGNRLKKGCKRIIIVQGGFLARVVYQTKECLNHINTMQMPNVISKRVRSSSRDAHTRELNTHERIIETTKERWSLKAQKSHKVSIEVKTSSRD